MAYNVRFSKEEIKQIGIRMYASRILTGMKREEFAEKQSISCMSIKNWELGRVLPRQEAILSILNAFKEYGVIASSEWVLYGSGAGPNYFKTSTFEQKDNHQELIEEQASVFKKVQRSKGHNPIVITVTDDAMEPFYLKGDIVGAIVLPNDLVKKEIQNSKCIRQPWLVASLTGDFIPAFIYFCSDKWFMNQVKNQELVECGPPTLAKIKWHYSSDEERAS